MAKTARTAKTGKAAKSATGRKPAKGKSAKSTPRSRPKSRKKSTSEGNAADALAKLIESPLVADLLAVGATAALAAITEHRFGSRGADSEHRTAKALKEAGKAAAAAMGRRLASEIDEIRIAAEKAKSGGAAKA